MDPRTAPGGMTELVPIRYGGGGGVALTGYLADGSGGRRAPGVLVAHAEATAAGIDWQLHLYGGVGHSFTNPDIDALALPGFAYDETADRRSWAAMLNLSEEVLEPA